MGRPGVDQGSRAGRGLRAARPGPPTRLRTLAVGIAAALLVSGCALGAGPADEAEDDGIDLRSPGPPPGGDIRDLARTMTEVDWVVPLEGYALEDEPWGMDLFREHGVTGAVPDPILGARNPEVRGRYVNTPGGLRATWTPEEPQLDIWFFGGSTMFGIGQRDDHTIPSVVARLAARDGIPVRATNFGVNGDVGWVAALRFAEALASSDEPPDVAVLYGGWNDRSLGQFRVRVGRTAPDQLHRLPLAGRERNLFGTPGPWPAGEANDLAMRLAAEQYAGSAATADALGRAHGVRVVHVFQPIAVTKRPAPSDEELWRRADIDRRFLSQEGRLYRSILERSEVDAIDLTAALDEVDEPVFVDHAHTNELGARVVARALYAELLPMLEGARP